MSLAPHIYIVSTKQTLRAVASFRSVKTPSSSSKVFPTTKHFGLFFLFEFILHAPVQDKFWYESTEGLFFL